MKHHTIHMTAGKNLNEYLIPTHSALRWIIYDQGVYHINWDILWVH